MGWFMLGTSMVATAFATDTPLALTGWVVTKGLSQNWFWWSMVPITMLGVFFFAPLWKRANPQVPDRSVFTLLSLGGVFSVGCFSLVLTDFQAVELSTDHCKAILYLGCVASGLGFFLWNKGASVSNPGTLAAFNNAVVPLAVLFSLFIFGEADNLDTESLVRLIVGAGLIGTAVLLGQRSKIEA